MKHLTFLCIILAIYGSERVRANSNSSKEVLLITKMNNYVEIYNEQLDKKVQWNLLNEAVNSIQTLFEKYEGNAKINMQALLEENRRAHNGYLFAVGPLFQWCGSVKKDLPFTVSVIQKPDLSDRTRSHIIKRTTDLLLRGVNQSEDSIHHVRQAIQHMGQLSVLLNVTEMKINEDFSTTGYYGIKRSELENQIRMIKETSGIIIGVVAAFGLLCTVILAFVATPVGIAIGLAVTLTAAGIPLGVIYGHTIPTPKQQITIIEEFYKQLQDALSRAKEECNKIDKALETEMADIVQVAADIKTPNPDDLSIPEFSDLFVDTLNTLSESCKKYVASHRSTSSRRRREAVAQKVPMTPVNYLLDAGMLLNQNYSVMHETVLANLKAFVSDLRISHLL